MTGDPFFAYFRRERGTISQSLYGEQTPPHKTYARCPVTVLPKPETISMSIDALLQKRASGRSFSNTPLTLEQLSALLYWSLGAAERDDGTRSYPSGGALYPVEPYVICVNVAGLPCGMYHYNSRDHTLECILQTEEPPDVVHEFGYPFTRDAGVILCLSFIKSRVIQKYGGLAYKLGMLEAGHIGQNVYLLSNALGVACCALGGGDTHSMHHLFGMDEGNEHLVYAVAIGTKDDMPQQSTTDG